MAERLSAIAAVLGVFDADLAAQSPGRVGPGERYRLRGAVRALLPLALDDPAFDVVVRVGDAGAAVRVRYEAGVGPTARLVIEPVPEPVPEPAAEPVAESAAAPVTAPATEPAPVARELADLLRRGKLGRR